MKTTQLLNFGVAVSGPMIVIMIRLFGQGADTASAEIIAHVQATHPEQFDRLTTPEPELLKAWEASIKSFQRIPTGGPEFIIDDSESLRNRENAPLYDILEHPDYALSAIFTKGKQEAAVLDNKIVWVGTALGNGWVLEKVDSQTRTVVLRHRSGKSHTIEFADRD